MFFLYRRVKVAVVSFHRNLVISSEEEAQRMLDAIDEAEKRGPVEYPDYSEALKRGEELVKRGRRK
jgi:hypothetical protein